MALDPNAVQDGVWAEYIHGIEVKLARMNNPAFREFVAMNANKYDDNDTLARWAVAHTIIRDWKNLEDDDDKPIPYSPEAAYKILNDEAYAHFYNWVDVSASQLDQYRPQASIDAEKQ